MPPELVPHPEPQSRPKGLLNAISASTHVPLGWIVGLMVVGGGWVAHLAFGAGSSETRLQQVESKLEVLGKEVAAERSAREEALRRVDKQSSELEGATIRTQTEIKYIREGIEDLKKMVGARR